MEEQRDGRDASDVGGAVEAGDDAREKLKGQVGEGAVCGGGGGGGILVCSKTESKIAKQVELEMIESRVIPD